MLNTSNTVAETIAAFCSDVELSDLPSRTLERGHQCVVDNVGASIAARGADYIASLESVFAAGGVSTVFGSRNRRDPAAAALINGVAAHGEDFDDTFEGSPMRAGSCVVPAVVAACESEERSGADLLRGVCIGLEVSYRFHRASVGRVGPRGFHHVGVVGTMGAAAGVSSALGLTRAQATMALGIAGSLASGLAEWRKDRAWTKRLHPGWSAQAGLQAARFARAGFRGPSSVVEGDNGWLLAFTGARDAQAAALTDGIGTAWLMDDIVFKPYPCATMLHPYLDCAVASFAGGLRADDIHKVECFVSPQVIPMLWEPSRERCAPETSYAAKFSGQFAVATALVNGRAGLAEFDDGSVRNEEILALARRVVVVEDLGSDFPHNYSARIRVHNSATRFTEYVQPHMRGGRKEPLSWDQIEQKFESNVLHGRGDGRFATRLLDGFLRELPLQNGMQELARIHSELG